MKGQLIKDQLIAPEDRNLVITMEDMQTIKQVSIKSSDILSKNHIQRQFTE